MPPRTICGYPDAADDPLDRAIEQWWHGNSTRLDELLEHDQPGGARIGALLRDLLHAHPAVPASLPAGSQIGPYVLQHEIGRGGMGIVFAAKHRETGGIVALKLLPAVMADDFHVRLFEREIRGLARLRHPGIATIFDAGRTLGNQRYFTMELIDGVPLNTYVRTRKLPLNSRLELFHLVCQALQHAHQNGIIHRDLKPANILVTSAGQPKILDFGLARMTDADITLTTHVNEGGHLMGTLGYMSPEQTHARLDEIDLRCDVYALGAILYELIADKPAFDLRQVPLVRALEIIRTQPPPPLYKHLPRLNRDLLRISQTALAKSPAERYDTVADLAGDVDNYLHNRPLRIRRFSATYAFSKLVQRHKVGFTVGVGALVALLAFVLTLQIQLTETARQRDRAVAAEQQKTLVQNFLLRDVIAAIDPQQALGHNLRVRDVLDEAARLVDTRFPDQPRLAATFHTTIGHTYRQLGLLAEANNHLSAALDLHSQWRLEDPAAYANALGELGLHRLDQQRYDDAVELHTQALKIFRSTLGNDHLDTSRCLVDLAYAHLGRADYAAAIALLHEALHIRELQLDTSHPLIIETHRRLGTAHHLAGLPEPALRHFQTALGLLPSDQYPLERAHLLNCLGNYWRWQGDLHTAADFLRESLIIRQDIYGQQHLLVAQAQMNLGSLLREWALQLQPSQRDPLHEEIDYLYGQVQQTYRALLDPQHPENGTILVSRGSFEIERQNPRQGENLLRTGMNIWKNAGRDHGLLHADAQSRLGAALAQQGRYAEAEPLLVSGLARVRTHAGPEHRLTRLAQQRLDEFHAEWPLQTRSTLKKKEAGSPEPLLPP